MAADVDAIVAAMPPPGEPEDGKTAAMGEDEYDPEEAAGAAVASALGMDPKDVDIPALCSALRDFIATAKG